MEEKEIFIYKYSTGTFDIPDVLDKVNVILAIRFGLFSTDEVAAIGFGDATHSVTCPATSSSGSAAGERPG